MFHSPMLLASAGHQCRQQVLATSAGNRCWSPMLLTGDGDHCSQQILSNNAVEWYSSPILSTCTGHRICQEVLLSVKGRMIITSSNFLSDSSIKSFVSLSSFDRVSISSS